MNKPLMDDIQAAIQLSHSGQREQARAAFDKLVPRLGDDPLANCILSHFMADVQPEAADELKWDLRSLEYLEKLSDDELQSFHESLTTAGFYASIYLNVADGYRKLGDRGNSEHYLVRAEDSLAALSEDGYGAMVRGGVERLRARLSGAAS